MGCGAVGESYSLAKKKPKEDMLLIRPNWNNKGGGMGEEASQPGEEDNGEN